MSEEREPGWTLGEVRIGIEVPGEYAPHYIFIGFDAKFNGDDVCNARASMAWITLFQRNNGFYDLLGRPLRSGLPTSEVAE